jgi:hypothetical protein
MRVLAITMTMLASASAAMAQEEPQLELRGGLLQPITHVKVKMREGSELRSFELQYDEKIKETSSVQLTTARAHFGISTKCPRILGTLAEELRVPVIFPSEKSGRDAEGRLVFVPMEPIATTLSFAAGEVQVSGCGDDGKLEELIIEPVPKAEEPASHAEETRPGVSRRPPTIFRAREI